MRVFTTIVALAVVAGCGGSYPKPTERLAASEGALRGAQEIGAPAHPQAALYLKMAQEEINRARDLMGKDENREADYMLQRARADAELAIAIARAARAQAELQRLEQGTRPGQGGMP